MSNKHATLSWAERFALIDQYKPEDTQVCSVFSISNDELSMARTLRDAGRFGSQPAFDAAKYDNPFTASTTMDTTPKTKAKSSSATIHSKPIVSADGSAPQTATKRVKIPQKRGRKGDKIQSALLAVPKQPISVDDFRRQYNVSTAVLRQSRRFISKMDVSVRKQIGTVKVRQDKDTKVLMIWREMESN
jgi:hypothetical protein